MCRRGFHRNGEETHISTLRGDVLKIDGGYVKVLLPHLISWLIALALSFASTTVAAKVSDAGAAGSWEYAIRPAGSTLSGVSKLKWTPMASPTTQVKDWKKGQDLWMRWFPNLSTLRGSRDPTLFSSLAFQSVQVFSGTNMQAVNSQGFSSDGSAFFNGYPLLFVPLETSSQEPLLFRFASEVGKIGFRGAVLVGPRSEIIENIIHQYLPTMAISGLFFLIGLFMALFFALNRNNRPALAYAILMLAMGTYIATRNDLFRLFVTADLSQHRFCAEIISMYFAGVGITFYVDSVFGSRLPFRTLHTVVYAYLGYAILAPAFALATGQPLYVTMLPWQILTLLAAPLLFFQPIRLGTKGDREALIFLASLITYMGTVTIDILSSLEVLSVHARTAPIGVVGLALGLGGIILLRYRGLNLQLKTFATELQEKNDALHKLDKMKDEFLANTSHELRTPLNGIIGISESLLAGAAGPVGTAMGKNLQLIARSGRRLANLVNDILDFSRIKERRLVLQSQAVLVHETIELVLANSIGLMERRPITLQNLVPKDLPLVEADDNRLQQVLHNLIGNAIKFTHEGTVTVGADHTDDTITFWIRDTGVGIPKDLGDSIFQSFEQGDASTTREFGGTGLGLSITKDIVELHGGRIWYESEAGQGSTFYFTMPLSKKALESNLGLDNTTRSQCRDDESQFTPTSHRNLTKHEKDLTLLIVDDEALNRQVLLNHLSGRGYDLLEAHDGPTALKIVGERIPDLILLDVMMPRMSGYEVCRELRLHHSASHLPIIFLTAKNQVSNLVEGFEAGANDYLIKPFVLSELVARVEAQLEQALLAREVTSSHNSLEVLVRGIHGVLTADSHVMALGRAVAAVFRGLDGGRGCFAEVCLTIPGTAEIQKGYSFSLNAENPVPGSLDLGDGVGLAQLEMIPRHTLSRFRAVAEVLRESNDAQLTREQGLIVPLHCAGQLLGFISMPESTLVELTPRARQFLAAFAETAGAAIARLRDNDHREGEEGPCVA